MGNRRLARQLALQLLYQLDITKEPFSKDDIEIFWNNIGDYYTSKIAQEKVAEVKEFVELIVSGVYKNIKAIDGIIEEYATNWSINRMAVVDRNILRLAVYELLYISNIPINVTLNEAIEISKIFGSNESGAFINGILDKIGNTAREKLPEKKDKNKDHP